MLHSNKIQQDSKPTREPQRQSKTKQQSEGCKDNVRIHDEELEQKKWMDRGGERKKVDR